jgi:hypothetical protein
MCLQMASYNDHFRAQELTNLQGPEKTHSPPPPLLDHECCLPSFSCIRQQFFFYQYADLLLRGAVLSDVILLLGGLVVFEVLLKVSPRRLDC